MYLPLPGRVCDTEEDGPVKTQNQESELKAFKELPGGIHWKTNFRDQGMLQIWQFFNSLVRDVKNNKTGFHRYNDQKMMVAEVVEQVAQ